MLDSHKERTVSPLMAGRNPSGNAEYGKWNKLFFTQPNFSLDYEAGELVTVAGSWGTRSADHFLQPAEAGSHYLFVAGAFMPV